MSALALRGFYAILDLKEAPPGDGQEVLARAEALLRAQPCMLQLRAKGVAASVVRDAAAHILPACHAARVPFCVNDRVDIALAVGADVVHVGQEDLPLDAVLRLVRSPDGPSLLVGVSTHNLAQARAAATGGADYIGFGPVFTTTSKERPDPVVGLDQLAEVAAELAPLSVVAIGGITRANVAQVVAAGAAAAAVIGDVVTAQDPTAAGLLIGAAFALADASEGSTPRRTRKRTRSSP